MNDMDTTGEEVLHQVLTWLAKRGVTVGVSRANPSVKELFRQYHLLELIGENRLYPTNRHALAAFRKETGQGDKTEDNFGTADASQREEYL